jgi:antitoxin ParD1/3/4
MKVETINISITQELAAFVRGKVESGMYTGVSEVIRDGLRMLRERDELNERRLSDVRARIDEGIDQLKRGDSVSGEEAREHFRRRSADRRRKGA